MFKQIINSASTLLVHLPTHTYAECKISGQQPIQLHKESPRIHVLFQVAVQERFTTKEDKCTIYFLQKIQVVRDSYAEIMKNYAKQLCLTAPVPGANVQLCSFKITLVSNMNSV